MSALVHQAAAAMQPAAMQPAAVQPETSTPRGAARSGRSAAPRICTASVRTAPKSRTTHYPEFFHPLPLVALLVLVVNDHLLKGGELLPGVLTGKLSDFAGLLYFPLFVTATLRWAGALAASILPHYQNALERALRLTKRKLLLTCITTGVGFAALQLSPSFIDVYVSALAALGRPAVVTADVTDLWALLSLPVAYWVGLKATA